jgi:hypothetical protein
MLHDDCAVICHGDGTTGLPQAWDHLVGSASMVSSFRGGTNAREHLSFGSGVHACLGAALARMERHRQVIWEFLWRSRCEWTGWRKMVADCVFQAAAAVIIWFQTAKRLVISVRHSGALIRSRRAESAVG